MNRPDANPTPPARHRRTRSAAIAFGSVVLACGSAATAFGSAALAASSVAAAQPSPATSPATTAPVLTGVTRFFPGTRISVVVPEGWQRLKSLAGFIDLSTRAEVSAVEYPFPYSETLKAAQAGGPLLKGYTVDRRDDITVEGRSAHLVKGTRASPDGGVDVRYWLVLGHSRKSVVVTGRYPAEKEADLEATVRAMVTGITWDAEGTPDVALRLPYTLPNPEGMRVAAGAMERVVWTEGGLRAVTAGKPFMQSFVVRRATKAVLEKEDAERQFKGVAAGRPFKVLSFERVRLPAAAGTGGGELEGFEGIGEITADATVTLTVYFTQLVHDDADAIYIVFGQTPKADAEVWIPRFKSAARGLKVRSDTDLLLETIPPSPTPPAPAAPPATPATPSAPTPSAPAVPRVSPP